MRGVWVDIGNDPTYSLYGRYGITAPFFDPRDQRVTAAYLDGVKAHPGITTCGIYTVWDWDSAFSDPKKYAEWTDAQLKRIGWRGNAPVCLNIEKGANGVGDGNFGSYVVSCLKRWRELRPKRDTWWSPPGMQGGLFSPSQVEAITDTKVVTTPQMYTGSMVPLAHDVTIDLLIHGFSGTLLDGMYDAAALPFNWRGFGFTQGRLPR